jgi:hypothetical protein
MSRSSDLSSQSRPKFSRERHYAAITTRQRIGQILILTISSRDDLGATPLPQHGPLVVQPPESLPIRDRLDELLHEFPLMYQLL